MSIMTNEVLTYCLEKEYPQAKAWHNFWIGYQTTNGTQELDSEILEWAVPDATEPTGDALRAIYDKHKDSYLAPVREAPALTPELVEAVEAYLRQRDKES